MTIQRSAALLSLFALLLFGVLGGGGCIFNPAGGGTPPSVATYLPPTSPENVVHNIQSVYINKDFSKYDSTLSTDYKFMFLQSDLTPGMPDSITHAEEVTFAEHLFKDGSAGLEAASTIRLKIDITGSYPDNRVGHEGWQERIVMTNLALDFSGGQFTTTVAGPAIFYFKQEPAGSGTWKFAEWDDMPANSSPSRLTATAALHVGAASQAGAARGAPTGASSWGHLRRDYR